MPLHRIHLDNQTYSNKPKSKEIGSISSRITENSIEIDIENLSHQLVCPLSKSWVPATLEGRRVSANWKSQSIFALDFDDGIAFSEVLERLNEYDLGCTWAHPDDVGGLANKKKGMRS